MWENIPQRNVEKLSFRPWIISSIWSLLPQRRKQFWPWTFFARAYEFLICVEIFFLLRGKLYSFSFWSASTGAIAIFILSSTISMLRHLWHRTESVLFSTPLGNISRNLYYYIHMYVPSIPLLRRTRIRGLLLAALCSKKRESIKCECWISAWNKYINSFSYYYFITYDL